MKKLRLLLTLATIIFLFISSSNYAQEQSVVGKLYTKADANTAYGPVQISVNVDTKVIEKLIKKSPDYIMFNIKSGKLMITSRKKQMLFSNDASLKSAAAGEIFQFVSTSKIKELLNLGGNGSITTIELRNDGKLTVTNGNETLEGMMYCPPYCP